MAVRAQRGINDAGPASEPRLAATKSRRGDGAGPVGLHKNIGVGTSAANIARPSAWLAQIDRGRRFPAAGVDDQGQHRRQMRCGNSEDAAPCTASVPAAHRAGNDAREVGDVYAASGRCAVREALTGASPICSMDSSGSLATA